MKKTAIVIACLLTFAVMLSACTPSGEAESSSSEDTVIQTSESSGESDVSGGSDSSGSAEFAPDISAPHVTEEMWEKLGFEGYVYTSEWPVCDEAKMVEATMEIVVQILGKMRGKVVVPTNAGKDEVLAAVKADEKIASLLNGKTVVKEIYVPGRLVNLIAK